MVKRYDVDNIIEKLTIHKSFENLQDLIFSSDTTNNINSTNNNINTNHVFKSQNPYISSTVPPSRSHVISAQPPSWFVQFNFPHKYLCRSRLTLTFFLFLVLCFVVFPSLWQPTLPVTLVSIGRRNRDGFA